MSDQINVLLADDDTDFRSLYRRLFTASDGIRMVEEASTGQEAIRKITALRPDVCQRRVKIDPLSTVES